MAESNDPKRQGGRLPRYEEDERIAYAVTCIRATPDAYKQSKEMVKKFGITRRAAIRLLAQARERIRRNLDIAWPAVAAELWHDVREGIAACRAKGDFRNLFRGLDVAAKLMPAVELQRLTKGEAAAQVMTPKEALECWAATTGVRPPEKSEAKPASEGKSGSAEAH